MTTTPPHLIHVVDDDAAFRRSLVFLLESAGYAAAAHGSAQEFLQRLACDRATPACLVLDIRMPVMSGVELQATLRAQGQELPIVFVTGHGDIELAVQTMKHGACDFLEKPFRDQALLDAVAHAVRRGIEQRSRGAEREQARRQLDTLSPREREVAHLVARGQPNKVVARSLAISDKTVQVHRQHVMEKTGTGSAAELARLMLRADPAALD